jgi:chromosome segregation ATPase
MRRELNPQLFQQPKETNGLTVQELHRIDSDYRELETQVLTSKTHVQGLDRKVEQVQGQFEELSKSLQSRLERINQHLSRLDAAHASGVQETAAKYAALAGKITERKVSDIKVQEMIDRHNTLVASFENRLTHVTRLLSEQEMKLHNSAAALEEARQEIARLRAASLQR